MTSILHSDINDIPEQLWNQCVEKGDVFHSHRFLVNMQKSKVENAEMYFVCVYNNGALIGTAVISIFRIDLSLFAVNEPSIQLIKKIFPNLLKTKICFCGLPLSVGQNSIRVKNEANLPLVIHKVQEHLNYLSKTASVSVYKEFSSPEFFDTLLALGYMKLPSLPGCKMDIIHYSTENYLQSMRAKYRRQVLSSWRKLEKNKPIIESDYFNQTHQERAPVFTILKGGEIPLDAFYRGYCDVMKRTEVQLEMLNQDFFSNFFLAFPKETFALCMVFQGEIYGMFVCFEDATGIRFLWTSIQDSKPECDVYQNLLSCLVNYSIDQKAKFLDLGQTSYYPKIRMGGKAYPMYFYLKANNKWVHRLLMRFQTSIFPTKSTPNLHVFRNKMMTI